MTMMMMTQAWNTTSLNHSPCVGSILTPTTASLSLRTYNTSVLEQPLSYPHFRPIQWHGSKVLRKRQVLLCASKGRERKEPKRERREPKPALSGENRKNVLLRSACGTGAACDFGEVLSAVDPTASWSSAAERSRGSSVNGAATREGGGVGAVKLTPPPSPKGEGGGAVAISLGGKEDSSAEDEPGGDTPSPFPLTLTGGEKSVRLKEPSWVEAVMPPQRQEGLLANMEGISLRDAMTDDAVYNKELSWLAFNWRVLYQALDSRTPLFERLRFMAITCRNMDEFFSKRVGALKRQEAAGLENLIKDQSDKAWTPQEQLKIVVKEVQKMVDVQVTCLLKELLPAIQKSGISLLDYDQLKDEQRLQLRKYFSLALEPILTPLAVDPGHPFPFIGNMSLSIAVVLRYPFDDDIQFAIVNVPTGLDRWKSMEPHNEDLRGAASELRNTFVSIEQIIVNNLDMLFGGMEILSAHVFRVTRNADVTRNEEEAEDLLEMITDEMRERKFAPFVRLEVDCQMPLDVVNRLAFELGLKEDDVYHICGPLGLGELDSLPVRLPIGSPLLFPPWSSLTHPRLASGGDIFEVIRKGDILVHHPYHSFATSTQHFVEAAARDPKVMAIKATLYRTNQDSPVIAALVQAAEAGKQVAVLVELKARFDEARNVGFAHMLENAGCNVAYGLVGLKTHCKSTMVVRREDDGLRTYVHIGTGNYNPRTASVYTDFGLLSCNPALGMDVADLFKYLTGYHRQLAYRKLLVAPGTMRPQFVRLIDREMHNAKMGLPASLVIKCNGLDDTVMVEKLYEASMAGVRVDCIVRGMCRIRPKVPGLSENIRVVSIIGRFLEHHRIFRFENGGNPEYYIGSSDWMSRNLMRRVEVVTPVEDESLKKELQEIIDGLLSDKRQAWEMRADGSYELLGVGPTPRPTPVTKGRKDNHKKVSLAKRAETEGVQQAQMERVAEECKMAKRFNLKKKDGSVQRTRTL